MELDIRQTGVICANCSWRNTGDGQFCQECEEALIPHRPAKPAGAIEWVKDQQAARTQLGLDTSVDDLRVLRVWAEASPSHSMMDEAEVASVCSACGKSFEEHVNFCSECGAETRSLEPSDRIGELRKTVRHLQQRVLYLEQLASRHPFDWEGIPTDQKWQVTWGVFGRVILIQIGLFIGTFFLLAALGMVAT